MRKFSYEVIEELPKLKRISHELSGFTDHEYQKKIFQLLEKRLKRKSVRVYFTRKIFEVLQEEVGIAAHPSQLFERQIPFIWETIITIQYLHNQIIDGKNGTQSPHKVRECLIVADNLKNALECYIEECVSLNQAAKKVLTKYMRQVFTYVNDGQMLEKTANTYSCLKTAFNAGIHQQIIYWPKELLHYNIPYQKVIENYRRDLPKEFQGPFDAYIGRIFLTNTVLFVFAVLLIGRLLQAPEQRIEDLCHFATGYGLSLQIVNDNLDFIYKDWSKRESSDTFSKKRDEDFFSDLKNGVLTAPILFHLGKDLEQKSILSNLIKSTHPQKHIRIDALRDKILEELFSSEALNKSILLSKELANCSKRFAMGSGENFALLRNLLSIALKNKYYVSAEYFEEELRQRKYVRKGQYTLKFIQKVILGFRSL